MRSTLILCNGSTHLTCLFRVAFRAIRLLFVYARLTQPFRYEMSICQERINKLFNLDIRKRRIERLNSISLFSLPERGEVHLAERQ